MRGVAGKFQDILEDRWWARAASSLYADPSACSQLISEKWLQARAVVGFFGQQRGR